MKSIGIKKCDYSSFNSFLAINFILVYKLVSRLSGSLYLMSTTIKKISQGKLYETLLFLEMLNFRYK
jgi:hypothetical protein